MLVRTSSLDFRLHKTSKGRDRAKNGNIYLLYTQLQRQHSWRMFRSRTLLLGGWRTLHFELFFTNESLHKYCTKSLHFYNRSYCTSAKMTEAVGVAQVSDYGSWKSPVTSGVATAGTASFGGLKLDGNRERGDVTYWVEMRCDEGGRYVVCSRKPNQETYTSWTPESFNARTRVHEYGGGSFFVQDGVVYFCNFTDQRMYKQNSPTSEPVPITPDETGWRYADAELNKKTGKIYSVREDHGAVKKGEAKEAKNTIVSINPDTQEQTVLASGCDFYSCPRVSSDGKQIAWVQWNHPNMPWDDTELWLAELTPSGNCVVEGSSKKVCGGIGVSVIHPTWTLDNQLLFLGDQTEWWNLYLVTPTGELENLLPVEAEIGNPHWTFGYTKFSEDPSGSGDIVLSYGKEIGIVNIKSKEYRALKTEFESYCYLEYSIDSNIYCRAGSPTQFPCIIRLNPKTNQVDILRESKVLPVDRKYISVPQEISWKTANGKISHGFFYPPQNGDYIAPEGRLPPLLVQAHGGPTGMTFSDLSLQKQYFTSRGFAILDVNYRGSTGYGRSYRNALRGNWGICDVEDCSSGAQYLADSGKVDANRLCIDGGSAGGFTTLACLAFTDVFKAGVSHYGVADLRLLAAETHKFESRYLDLLIASYDDEHKHIYTERSPIEHIDKFNCAVAFFQGDEDEIVPPNQAELMFKGVKENGKPCSHVLFKGEQHGFRKAENIQAALDGEFYFFCRVFGATPAETPFEMEIFNL